MLQSGCDCLPYDTFPPETRIHVQFETGFNSDYYCFFK